MGYAFAKIVLALLLPPASLVILILFGFILAGCCRGIGKFLILLGVVGLYSLSISPVSDALLKPLESYAPPLRDGRVKADAIIVLGGGTLDGSWVGIRAGLPAEAEARVVQGVILYRRYHIPLIMVGGSGNPATSSIPDADIMGLLARSLGVSSKHIITENKSRNTLEGARAVSGQVRARRIILVTSAYHMKRAAAMFRKQGFEVIPSPAAYLSEQKPITLYSFIPHADRLAASASACSEYLSQRWYSLTGDM
jgi:uncharacterized SAM-binding protein YcdF (DUF218 family)